MRLVCFWGSRERWSKVPRESGGFGFIFPSKLVDKRCISGFVLPGMKSVAMNLRVLTTKVNIVGDIHAVHATL